MGLRKRLKEHCREIGESFYCEWKIERNCDDAAVVVVVAVVGGIGFSVLKSKSSVVFGDWFIKMEEGKNG